MRWRDAAAAACLVLFSGVVCPVLGAAPDAPANASIPAPPGIVIAHAAASPAILTPDTLAKLPASRVEVVFGTEHGPQRGTFEGPLLWTVLVQIGAVDAAHPRDQVRQSVAVTGRDGYVAVLAMGEIAPAFEGKQVVLASRTDGKPLGPEHFRVVVPGDQRGGRSVRDVARIEVLSVGSRQH